LGNFDATQLQKALAGKAVSVQPAMDELTEGLVGGASPRDLETLLQLAWLHFTSPRDDSTTFRSLMTRYRGFLENQEASPENAFSDTLSVTMSQYHPRARPVTVRTLDEIDPHRSLGFYRDRYSDASDFTFVFVGSFQPDSIRPMVLRWLGGLPGQGRTETWRDNGMRPPAGVVTKVVRRGVEPKSQTAIVFAGPFTYSRTNTHLLGSLGSALELRLRDVLREELGGTYSVNVGPAAARDPWQNYAMTIAFGSAPERADSLAATVFKEIAALQANGPDDATLQKVKETQRRSHETNVKENGWWMRQITTSALQGTDVAAGLNTLALIDAMTAEQIAQAAREYLRSDRYIKVVLMPER
jgi:zinc protease